MKASNEVPWSDWCAIQGAIGSSGLVIVEREPQSARQQGSMSNYVTRLAFSAGDVPVCGHPHLPTVHRFTAKINSFYLLSSSLWIWTYPVLVENLKEFSSGSSIIGEDGKQKWTISPRTRSPFSEDPRKYARRAHGPYPGIDMTWKISLSVNSHVWSTYE